MISFYIFIGAMLAYLGVYGLLCYRAYFKSDRVNTSTYTAANPTGKVHHYLAAARHTF